MKSIMTSVSPYLCEKIANGQCKILVRKSALKEVPFKAYIYCTKTKNKWNLSDYEGAYQNSVGEIVYAQQHVIGEFICNEIEAFHEWELSPQGKFAEFEEKRLKKFLSASCLSIAEVVHYRENLPYYKPLYGWHISDLKIYDKPKELSEFKKPCPTKEKGDCLTCDCLADNDYGGICTNFVTRPPQSYMFVEEM